ncbi:ricin-type beta-trefoil lectin domain protein [Streptomyces sp. NRRL F-2664]|uniref:ricin-type beta-trefoil lectin domain protein n=1 Tax=Streptomyces sp. NRRL F-2664 TaxID=1463842 RepID=UPI003B6406ED
MAGMHHPFADRVVAASCTRKSGAMTAESSPRNPSANSDARNGGDTAGEVRRYPPAAGPVAGAPLPNVFRPTAPAPLDEASIAAFADNEVASDPTAQRGHDYGGLADPTEQLAWHRGSAHPTSAPDRRIRTVLVAAVSATALTGAVLVFGADEQRPDVGMPPSVVPSPVQPLTPRLNGSVGASAAADLPTSRAGESPSASAPTPTKTAARRHTAAPQVSSNPQKVAFVGAASALCIDASTTRLQLASCDSRATQLFTRSSAHELRTATGLCAGAPSGASRGSLVVAEECNGSQDQRWTIAKDGSIHQGTLCLDALNAGTGPGTLIQLWDCGGGDNQDWRASAPRL